MGLAGYGPVPEPGYYFKIYARALPKGIIYRSDKRLLSKPRTVCNTVSE